VAASEILTLTERRDASKAEKRTVYQLVQEGVLPAFK
jgi:hypothetical protein